MLLCKFLNCVFCILWNVDNSCWSRLVVCGVERLEIVIFNRWVMVFFVVELMWLMNCFSYVIWVVYVLVNWLGLKEVNLSKLVLVIFCKFVVLLMVILCFINNWKVFLGGVFFKILENIFFLFFSLFLLRFILFL